MTMDHFLANSPLKSVKVTGGRFVSVSQATSARSAISTCATEWATTLSDSFIRLVCWHFMKCHTDMTAIIMALCTRWSMFHQLHGHLLTPFSLSQIPLFSFHIPPPPSLPNCPSDPSLILLFTLSFIPFAPPPTLPKMLPPSPSTSLSLSPPFRSATWALLGPLEATWLLWTLHHGVWRTQSPARSMGLMTIPACWIKCPQRSRLL